MKQAQTALLQPAPAPHGNAMILALLSMMLATAVMLWVTQVSTENFRRNDRHMFQEDAFYAAQGAADAVVADIQEAYRAAWGNGDTPEALDFVTWLKSYRPALQNPGAVDLPEWSGRSFNAATVNRVRVTRVDGGTANEGMYVSLRVEAEAAPSNSTNPADFVTVTRLFNATNRQQPDLEYAILTENISCTLCHLRVSTLEFAKDVEGEKPGSKFKRALIATTKYMNARFESADSEIHGTFYISAGARVENHGSAADLSTVLNNGQFRMAALSDPASPDADGIVRAEFSGEVNSSGNLTGNAILDKNLQDYSNPLVPNKPLYLKYPGKGDYNLDEKFPSPFPDVGDENGNGSNNRTIDPVELEAKKTISQGEIKASFVTRVSPNSVDNYKAKTYTYNDPKLPDTSTAVETTIKTGEQNNLILIGTKKNPIEIKGQVVIEGDVMISGYVKGTGLLMATGNVYIPSDIKYDNPIDEGTKKETFVNSNRIGYAAGGNIVIGDYISRVSSHSSNYMNGAVEVGKPEVVVDPANPQNILSTGSNYANYVAEQLAISNRDELAKTMKMVPGSNDGAVADPNAYNTTNPAYDPNYTPRYYTMYPDTEPYAFIKRNGKLAKFNTDHKAWETGETPNIYSRDQYSIYQVPDAVRDTTNKPRLISVHPTWISPENMIKLIANEETKRRAEVAAEQGKDPNADDLAAKPFRIDGLLYTNNAIFSIQRRKAQYLQEDGTWKIKPASHRGRMEINGSVIAPDLGILVAGEAKNSFSVNYDRRVRLLINGWEPGKWKWSVDGFARFSGPMAP